MTDQIQISTIRTQIDRFCSESKKVAKRVESSFLKTSLNLEEIMSIGSNLIEESQLIIEIATGTGDQRIGFDELFESLGHYLGELSTISEEVLHACQDTADVGIVLDEIVELEKRLMATLQPLKTMRIFFQIESVDLSAKDRSTFLALVEDIGALHEEAESITKNEFKQISDCQKGVGDHTNTVNREIASFRETIEFEGNELSTIKTKLKHELTQSRGLNVELIEASKRISAFVSEIVTVIQNDDIAAQKAQHVMEVVETISEKLKTWSLSGYELDDHEIPLFLVTASKIQQAQIDSILKDYRYSLETISEICPKISNEILYLDQECLSLREFSTLTTSADGVIQVLLDALSTVHSLLARLVKILRNSYEIIAPMGELSSEVNTILENITEELRVVTVNAKIKASKQSKRTGLDPLTENVGVVSIETQRISYSIGNKLDVASRDLKNLVLSFSKYCESGQSLYDSFSEHLKETEKTLHDYRNSALDKIMDLSKDAEQADNIAKEFLNASRSGFTEHVFYEDLSVCLGNLIEVVHGICGDQVDFSSIESEEIDNLSENYTMQEEVRNQNKVMGVDSDVLADHSKEDDMIFF